MPEKHYARLAPSYVADTIRADFPTLGIAEESMVTPIRGNPANQECKKQSADRTMAGPGCAPHSNSTT
jgi:hypothetical protein